MTSPRVTTIVRAKQKTIKGQPLENNNIRVLTSPKKALYDLKWNGLKKMEGGLGSNEAVTG